MSTASQRTRRAVREWPGARRPESVGSVVRRVLADAIARSPEPMDPVAREAWLRLRAFVRGFDL